MSIHYENRYITWTLGHNSAGQCYLLESACKCMCKYLCVWVYEEGIREILEFSCPVTFNSQNGSEKVHVCAVLLT